MFQVRQRWRKKKEKNFEEQVSSHYDFKLNFVHIAVEETFTWNISF